MFRFIEEMQFVFTILIFLKSVSTRHHESIDHTFRHHGNHLFKHHQSYLNVRYELDQKTRQWINASYDLFKNINCSSQVIMSEKICGENKKIPQQAMGVWTTPSASGPYKITLPEGSLKSFFYPDGVVMIDLYPRASWGHLVIVFLITKNTKKSLCQGVGKKWTDGDCLIIAQNDRCRNMISKIGRNQGTDSRRCDIIFPPLVSSVTEGQTFENVKNGKKLVYGGKNKIENNPLKLFWNAIEEGFDKSEKRRTKKFEGGHNRNLQELKCQENAEGFGPCVWLQQFIKTHNKMCDPLALNTHRCPNEERMHSHCRMFERCDQAVLISGGWFQSISTKLAKENFEAVYNMTRRAGFLKDKIKMFFENGIPRDKDSRIDHAVYPASMKISLRHHLKHLCDTPLCTDSLLVYLTGPTMSDGSLLLWDVNQDGLAEENEIYKPRELLEDLKNCKANAVTVLLDVSFAGEILHRFQSSKQHSNVQVYGSGGIRDYSWDKEYSHHWSYFDHSHSCTQQVHEASFSTMKYSTPVSFDPFQGEHNNTIFNAPCDAWPPLSQKELHRNYFGCQNVPLALWLQSFPYEFHGNGNRTMGYFQF